MSNDELITYQRSLKAMWDSYAQNKTSFDKGIEEGIELGVIQTAKNLKAMNMTIEMIQQATGLTAEQVEGL